MTMDPVTFLKVVSGSGNPMMMFMTGKIKAKGDLGLAANMTGCQRDRRGYLGADGRHSRGS